MNTWQQGPQLTRQGAMANDQFGWSVAFSRDGATAIVGVLEEVDGKPQQGSAIVFVRAGDQWVQQARLIDIEGASFDRFGRAVALSADGNTAIVGAYGDNVGSRSNQGSVTIFTRTGSTWTREAKLTASDGAALDQFGISVALSGNGDTAIVGAFGDSVGNISGQGSARVFTRANGAWSEQASLHLAADGEVDDNFGYSVALSSDGNTAVVGALYDDVNSVIDQGSATIFTRLGTEWTRQKILTHSGGAASDIFGFAVALSADGRTAIVGAPQHDPGGNQDQGAAFIFTGSGNNWVPQQSLTSSTGQAGDSFGYTVGLSSDGNIAAVGAPLDDIGPNADQGSAFVFERSGDVWSQRSSLADPFGQSGDNFGIAVAITGDGSTVVSTAQFDDVTYADQGSATTFTIVPGRPAASISIGAGSVHLQGADMHLSGPISAIGFVTLSSEATERSISLGSDAADALNLSDEELDRIAAAMVGIGDTSSGNITVSGAISPSSNLTLTTGGGITIAQSVTMAADKSLSAITASTSAGISLTTASSDIVASGVGAISLTTARNISLANGASVRTADGEILLSANQQPTPTSGIFVGLDINGGIVESTGNGTVTLQGRGEISTSDSNHGVRVTSSPAKIASSGGAVLVEGTGGGEGISQLNHGVFVGGGALITNVGAGAAATVTVKGQGGNAAGSGSSNIGVFVNGLDTRITSNGGAVLVEGVAGGGAGNSGNNYGVQVGGGMITSAGVNAPVTVEGLGGNAAGTGSFNYGVVVLGSTSRIASSGGDISVTAVAGSGANSHDILVQDNGQIAAAAGAPTMTLAANSLSLLSTTSINAGANTVVLRPRTAGTLINLGGSDVMTGSPRTLGLDDAELDRVIAGTMIIGDTASGAVTVSSAITHANHLLLITGNGISFAQPVTMASGKSLSAMSTSETVGISLATANADLATSGHGAISLTAARNISLASGSSVKTVDGDIHLRANQHPAPTSGAFVGINIDGGIVESTGAGAVTLHGRGGNAASDSNHGVRIVNSPGKIASGGGAVLVEGTGGGAGASQLNHGVVLGDSALITNAGAGPGATVTVKGQGGSTAGSGSSNLGIDVNGFNARITSSGGAVLVEGSGGGGAGNSSNNYGVQVGAGTITSANAAATVTVSGQGGNIAGTGSFNYGVVVLGSLSRIASSGGDISVNASSGSGSNSHDILMANNGQVVATAGTPTVTLAANSLSLQSTTSINASANTVVLRPRTAGTLINLGGSDAMTGSPRALGLDDAELDRIAAGRLIIGDASSGRLTVSAAITRPASTAMELHSGGAIVFNPGSLNTAGGSLLLAASGGVQPVTSGFDVMLNTATASVPSDVHIAIGGKNVDTQSSQLKAAGNVDLTGAGLVLSGAYVPVAGDVFTVVSATQVTGQFLSLAHGDEVVFNGIPLTINYSQTAVTLIANQPPMVSGPVIASASEDDAVLVVNLLAGTSDANANDVLSVANLTLLSGDARGVIISSNSLIIDPSAYDSLAEGEEEVIHYSYEVSDGRGGVASQTATITIEGRNEPLVVSISGAPETSPEGAPITLSASLNFPQPSLEFVWSVTKDGESYASGAGAAFTFVPNDDGEYAINLTALDESHAPVSSATAAVHVKNEAPIASIHGRTDALQGETLTFTINANDSSQADEDAGFTYRIDWDGDGVVDETKNGATSIEATNLFAHPGAYQISIIAVDKEGEVSDRVQLLVNIGWNSQFGGIAPGSTSSTATATDTNGNIFVVGSLAADNVLPGQANAGGVDVFVRKYNSVGGELWTQQFGTSSKDVVAGMSVDGSGNVYIVGSTLGTLQGHVSGGSYDAFVRKYSSTGSEVWTRQFGTNSSDHAAGISVDGSGNVYVVGSTSGALAGQASAGGQDAFVRKYSSTGSEVWTRQFGTSSSDSATGTSVDGSGNVYIAGHTPGALAGQASAGGQDAFVRKYSSTGSELWTRQFGTSSSDSATGTSVDGSGNVYVIGHASGALTGQTRVGGQDTFVRKYSSTGSELWTRQFGTSTSDWATGVSVDVTGNVYVVGHTSGTLPGQASAGGQDAFVRKYSSTGSELWTRQFGTSSSDSATGTSVDGSGNVYVVGHTSGALAGQTRVGGQDTFVRKYSSTGSELWTRQFGATVPAYEQGNAVAAGENIYVVGHTSGALPGQTSAGGADGFVHKYSSTGGEIWARQFGSSSSDLATGVSVDGSGDVYIVGYTYGAFSNQASSGGTDVFVRKISSTGTELWTRQFGSNSHDEATGVSVDATGNVYIVGNTSGILPGQTGAGGRDVFVRKISSAGVDLWTRQFGSSSSDYSAGVSVDVTGNVYVAGSTSDTLPGQTGAGSSDAFVRKISSTGTELWTRQFGSTSNDESLGVSVDVTGNVYLVGYIEGALPGLTGAGSIDAFVQKFSSTGVELWARQFGSNSPDLATDVFADASGNVYVVGRTLGALPGQISAGLSDAFVRTYNAGGGDLWTRQFGTSSDDFANGVSVDALGTAYVIGYTSGALPGQINPGNTDAFVAQFRVSVADPAVSTESETLTITGESGDDLIVLDPGPASNQMRVTVNGALLGTYTVSGPIVVNAGGGNDQIIVNAAAGSSIVLDGKEGSDIYTVNAGGIRGSVTIADSGPVGDDRLVVRATDEEDYVDKRGDTIAWWPRSNSPETSPGLPPPALTTVVHAGVEQFGIHLGAGNDFILDPGSDTEIFGDEGDDIYVITATSGDGVLIEDHDGVSAVTVFVGELAGPLNIDVSSGAGSSDEVSVTIVGTDGADEIVVSPDGIVTGTGESIFFASVPPQLTIDTGGGADLVTLDDLGDSPTNYTISGGDSDEGDQVQVVGSRPPTLTASNINTPPVAHAGPDQTIAEGALVAFDGSGSQDFENDSLTYAWNFGDGGTGSGAAPSHIYSDNGVYHATLTVTDPSGASHTDTLIVTVTNVAPTAQAKTYSTVQAMAVSGNLLTDNTGTGADADPAGANDPLTVISATQPSNGRLIWNANGSFTYTPDTTFSGTDSFTYTISDGDGGADTTTVKIVVAAAAAGSILTVPDSLLGGAALLITGTDASDQIAVEPGLTASTLKVTLNGAMSVAPLPTGRIIVIGGEGDDDIQIAGTVGSPVWLYGDAGNDRLNAGNSGSLLIGGNGNDELLGGAGRDVMIGGNGADKLIGNNNDDILIAGFTARDTRLSSRHEEFWSSVLLKWSGSQLFHDRVATLRDTLLPEVFDDVFADEFDFLNGAAGEDWLIFMTGEDKVLGKAEASN
jgi:hypothetical protein